MNCHSCPHSEAILRGDYDSTPWDKLPCARCKLGEDTFYSIPFDEENPPACTVGNFSGHSFSDGLPPAGAGIPSHGGVPEGRGGSPHLSSDFCLPSSGSPLLPADLLASFVQGLLNLPAELRDVVAWRYQGVTYREIAERQGTSIQLAEMRHKRAMREWPALKSLFPRKTAKRQRRLSHQ
jgi:hypothetical protein